MQRLTNNLSNIGKEYILTLPILESNIAELSKKRSVKYQVGDLIQNSFATALFIEELNPEHDLYLNLIAKSKLKIVKIGEEYLLTDPNDEFCSSDMGMPRYSSAFKVENDLFQHQKGYFILSNFDDYVVVHCYEGRK